MWRLTSFPCPAVTALDCCHSLVSGRELSIVGVNHRTAPVAVRERLAAAQGDLARLDREMFDVPGVDEAVVLSTCNRVEVVTCCADGARSAPLVAERLFLDSGVNAEECSDYFYEYHGRDAVRHVFRVAASLDSMVVGEPQILGQIKTQFDTAVNEKAAGAILHRVFHKSFSVAKRVRNETGIAARTVSVAATGVDLARSIFESLADSTVMLIGAGDTGETAARHFRAAGVRKIMVVNRTLETAVELARSLEGTPIPLQRLDHYLPLADLVVGSAGGGELLSEQAVRAVMKKRRGGPMFFIDLAVPRNFAPAINEIDDVYLYDVDDLVSVVEDNLDERRREAVSGEMIVEGEVDRFWQWFERLDVAPTIASLRDVADRIRREELDRTLSRMSELDPEAIAKLDQMTRAIVNKLMHHPTHALRSSGDSGEDGWLVAAARRLFRLGDDG
ncbi:MAG: glutamyl-tRNA reductase [Hyphomicrobiaceae bacterium]|jgi:glutamyl-tRNA reductase